MYSCHAEHSEASPLFMNTPQRGDTLCFKAWHPRFRRFPKHLLSSL